MSQADRDLVEAIRSELAAIDPSRPCDRAAERAALATVMNARDGALARLWVRLSRDARGTADRDAFDWDGAAGHCRIAWLRGVFLARGSLSLAGGRTHLEWVVDPEAGPALAARLAAVGLPALVRTRRGRGVVISKNGELVGQFLRRLGGGAVLLELEARQVARALRGELNRVLNAESANLQRAVGAAGRQLAAIDRLEADGDLGSLPVLLRRVAAARRETPEATLGELATRLRLHRSAVQRALERLERLAAEPAAGRRETARAPVRRRRAMPGPAPDGAALA